MLSPTFLLIVAFYLRLQIASSAEILAPPLPNCTESSALRPDIRDPLVEQINIRKRQEPYMKYNCTLDHGAFDFLLYGKTGGLTYTRYVGKKEGYAELAKKAADAWSVELIRMGRKSDFGCNLIEKFDKIEKKDKFIVACLYAD